MCDDYGQQYWIVMGFIEPHHDNNNDTNNEANAKDRHSDSHPANQTWVDLFLSNFCTDLQKQFTDQEM